MKKSDKTKQEIIETAEILFLENGILNTNMESIAKKIVCHRRTLYRYFPRKEDLMYEVAIRLIDKINQFQGLCADQLSGPGIDRFSGFLKQLIGHMEKHADIVRLLAEFDFLINDRSAFQPTPEREAVFNETAHQTERILSEIIISGTDDGSITLNDNQEIFIQTVTATLWSLAQKLAVRGAVLDREFATSGRKWILCQINIFTNAIKSGRKTDE